MRPPTRLPKTAAAVKNPIMAQSSWLLPVVIRAAKAVVLLMAMTSNEVRTATGIGNPSKSGMHPSQGIVIGRPEDVA